MVAKPPLHDYYAVLKVQPDADAEIIEAAYRQLMKKHHPDRAGDDPRRAAEMTARATEINQAFSVLRDPVARHRYDLQRELVGAYRPHTAAPPPRPAPSSPGATPSSPGATAWSPGPTTAWSPGPATLEVPDAAAYPAPLTWLAAAYYLLPGPYEWEPGQGRELLLIVLLPIVGTAAFALASGRLTPLIGHSLSATAIAWALLGLGCVPLLQSLPRVLLACAPSGLLLSGMLNPLLATAHLPQWLTWSTAGLVSLAFSARLFVFSVLPTLAVCWLLSLTWH